MWPTQNPSIRVFGSGPRCENGRESNSTSLDCLQPTASTSIPMPIPNIRDTVPPPLPPPRHIEELSRGKDPGWQWANGKIPAEHSPEHSFRIGSLLRSDPRQERPRALGELSRSDESRRLDSQSLPAHLHAHLRDQPEQRDDDGLQRPGYLRLQSATQLGLRTLHTSSQQFDRQLLSKLDGPSSRPSTSNLSSSLPSPLDSDHARKRNGRPNGALKPLSVPDSRHSGPDSPLPRWPGSSPSAVSSASATGMRSPLFESTTIDYAISPPHHRLYPHDHGEDVHSSYRHHRNSIEQGVFGETDMEESGMRDLNINDRCSAEDSSHGSRTLKRRAASPTLEIPRAHTGSGNHNDLYHRRSMQMLNNRNSPTNRLPPPIGSASTTSSLAQSQGSHWNFSVASSATSYSSQRISPSALSPSAESEFAALSPPGAYQPRELDLPNERASEIDMQNTLLLTTGAAGLYVCECCVKKPRRFRTLDDLQNHQNEKQFQCAYCPNRFKNKNEAERHQNSLHLRRYSWSCAALVTARHAFHPHLAHPSTSDVCGYCGQEFSNPADWDARSEHLVNVHKFGECNQHKKFFRADHFRQHLKHSHGAASGKWTNMLEATCVKDEPLPHPIRSPIPMSASSGRGLRPMSNEETHNS